jgi:hypothetical protein
MLRGDTSALMFKVAGFGKR